MPTRQFQIDFEESLTNALNKKEIVDSLSKIIIKAVESHFAEAFEAFENKIKQLENEIDSLKSQNNKRNDTNISSVSLSQKGVEKKLDDMLQKNRNNNIRFLHIPEAENENVQEKITTIIRNKLKVNLDRCKITAAYRVGQKIENSKPRHIVVSFADSLSKMSVYKKKSLLKGTNYIIKEDLTLTRLTALKEASIRYGFKNVWSMNGVLFAKTENGVEKISIYKDSN